MASLLAGISFALTWVVVLLWMRSSSRLLEGVHREAPDTWRRLGRPERVWVHGGEGGIRIIKPLLPWLLWLWKGRDSSIAGPLERELGHARRLLCLGVAMLAVSVTVTIHLAVSASA